MLFQIQVLYCVFSDVQWNHVFIIWFIDVGLQNYSRTLLLITAAKQMILLILKMPRFLLYSNSLMKTAYSAYNYESRIKTMITSLNFKKSTSVGTLQMVMKNQVKD